MTEPLEDSSRPADAPAALERCPACGAEIDMAGLQPFTEVACPACGAVFTARSRFDHFEIQSLLGEGGMGSVYQAVDSNLDREVALKVLKLSLSSNPGECEKLEREARTTALINHPHIIKIFDFGHSQGQFYIAMELIGGGSLDDLIQTYGTVPEKMVLNVGVQVAQGLEAALEQDLIHRDIKPANILFADIDTAKLVDFGLAMVMSDAAQARGEIWGTPYYIAPEKLDEQPEDFRSDIYSLGGTMFHALAGRPPYEAESASLVALKQLKSRPVSLQAFAPGVSNETAYVINRMMAKNPEKRYGSYRELVEHLQFALEKINERESNPREAKVIPVLEEKSGGSWVSMLFPVAVLIALAILIALIFLFPELFRTEE